MHTFNHTWIVFISAFILPSITTYKKNSHIIITRYKHGLIMKLIVILRFTTSMQPYQTYFTQTTQWNMHYYQDIKSRLKEHVASSLDIIKFYIILVCWCRYPFPLTHGNKWLCQLIKISTIFFMDGTPICIWSNLSKTYRLYIHVLCIPYYVGTSKNYINFIRRHEWNIKEKREIIKHNLFSWNFS